MMGTADRKVLLSKQHYDAKTATTDEKYEVGQKVLYREYRPLANESKSFGPKYRPEIYTIVKRIGSNYFLKNDNDENEDAFCVNFSQIRKYESRDDEGMMQLRDKVSQPLRLGFHEINEEGTIE